MWVRTRRMSSRCWAAAARVVRAEPRLLATVEQALQLEQSFDLGAPALSVIILLKTDGIIGEVATLLARAAVHAIRTGVERIDRQVVDACGHQSPRERRRLLERALR